LLARPPQPHMAPTPRWAALLGLLAAEAPAAADLPVVAARLPLPAEGHADGVAAARDLASCLVRELPNRTAIALQGDGSYHTARLCRNRRADIDGARPLAVVRVQSTQEVQLAVRCAAQTRTQVCARAGGHGFENDACCPGGTIVDLQDLQALEFRDDAEAVTFASGHTLGQLYYKLREHVGPKTPHGLVVPGGAESGVGAAGLFLGCGRGMLSQMYGLACDSVREIEFVDAEGGLQTANPQHDPDMFWLARGGSGNFPGIVTSFMVQAYHAPRELWSVDCHLYHAARIPALVQAWLRRLPEMVEPRRKIFTHVKLWGGIYVKFANICIDCDDTQKAWLESSVRAIVAEAGEEECHTYSDTWYSRLLHEAGVSTGVIDNDPKALTDREQGYGIRGEFLASKNGGHVIRNYSMSDALLETLAEWTFGRMPPGHPYGLLVLLYPLGGSRIEAVPAEETAYGARDAKLVVHTKHQWHMENAEDHELMMQHYTDMTRALERHPEFQCRGFINYVDNTLPCTRSNREWLEAYFHNVDRMVTIKAMRDPGGVFRSHLPLPPSGQSSASETGMRSSRRRRRALITVGRVLGADAA